MDKNKTKNLLGPYANKTFFMNTLMKLCTYCTWKKKTSKISKEASPTAKAEDLLFPLIYHISIRLIQSISFILKAPVLSKLSTPSCLPRTERKKIFHFYEFPRLLDQIISMTFIQIPSYSDQFVNRFD